MKIIDKIMDSLSIFDEEEISEEELLSEEKAAADKKEKSSLFAKKTPRAAGEQPEEAEPAKKRSSVLNFKGAVEQKDVQQGGEGKLSSRTLNLPVANKLVTVVVLEPVGFDDSQKIADYLRNNQPVVVNFANADNVVAKRMTDYLSGTVYALGGSMKKLSRNIVICAPKNTDIDSDLDTEEGSKFGEGGKRPWEK